MPSNTSLYGSTSSSSNVGSNNFTTLYSPGAGVVRTQLPYGNSNVVSLLNAGTDGGNTITNIVATGNVTANNFFGNFIGNTSNANYANFAGTAFSVAGANVSGEVANANYASFANIANTANTANAVAGANVSGVVANANYSAFSNVAASANSVNVANVVGIGNIAVLNLTSSSSNVLYGNGVFAPISGGNSANANYANFAGNLINGNSNVNTNGSGGNVSISVNGVSNVATFNSATINLNYPVVTPNNVSIGNTAGNSSSTQIGHVSIGANAGTGSKGSVAPSISIGSNVGTTAQGNAAIALGTSVGLSQGDAAIAIGYAAADQGTQGGQAIALGYIAGRNNQGTFAVAIGSSAGAIAQGNASIAIGKDTGGSNLGSNAIAIGREAMLSGSGLNSIAIGAFAGKPANAAPIPQPTNSIVLNATGTGVTALVANTFVVKPVRNANTANVMFYDNTTGEITYDLASNATIANANFANFAGTAFSVAGANVSGEVANANYASFANIANTANLATFATTANSVAGANVSGEVANANYASFANIAASANSVAVANVSGIGNIATINLDGSSSNVLYGNGVFAPESTSIANANFANFAGNVTNSAQPNITSVGTLTSLSVSGNTDIGGVLTLSSNSNTLAKITALSNAVDANSRFMYIQAGDINSANIANGNTAGLLFLNAGGASASTDSGTRWNALGGSAQLTSGAGLTANGSANGGALSITAGSGFANLFAGVGGIVQLNGGRAAVGNANSTGGNVTLISGRAQSNTSGTSTSGNINLVIGNVVGASGNVRGSINIGSLAPVATTTFPANINIGQANTPTQIGGNANIAGNLIVVGNVTANFFNGNGSLLTGIVATNANFANFAGNVTVSSQPNITSVSNTFSSGQLTLNTTTSGNPIITMNGVVGSSNGRITINQGSFLVFNEDLLGGQSPFSFNIYGSSAYQEPINYFRARGTQASPANCVAGDTMLTTRWQVYANSAFNDACLVSTSYQGFTSGVGPFTNFTFASAGDTANSRIEFQSGILNLKGNVTLGDATSNTQISNSSLFKLSIYTAAALTAITGVQGQIACVTDSASGGNPNGMIAFWDTTNARWSYIHDNSAV
jgi:hypothetical protein